MSKKILLADDSVTIQKVVELTFLDQDVEVETVSSGEEAVERLASTRPDVVIADVHMPGVDGYEVCRESKRAAPGRPVLLLVGTFEPFDPQEYESSGADAYLKKPFDSQELLRQVDELVSAAASRAVPEEAPAAEPAAAPAPEATAPTASSAAGDGGLSDAEVERVARRVAEILGEKAVRDVAWEVVPDLAEVVIRERLQELEGQVD